MVTKVRAPRFAGQAFDNQSTEAAQALARLREAGDIIMYPYAKNQGLGKQQPESNLNLGNSNPTNDSVAQRQSSGNEMPTMVQFYEPAKGARGGRLGASPAFAATTTQFGYSQPGANITVSPTFSNIGSPNVNVAGRDMSLGGPGPDVFGGPGADVLNTTVQNPPTGAPQTPTGAPQTPTGVPKPQTPTSTNRPRTPRPQTPTGQPQSGGGAKIKAKNKAAQKALSRAQSKGPGDKITKDEMNRLLANKGYRAISSQVKKGNFTIGAGAKKVLDRKAQKRNR